MRSAAEQALKFHRDMQNFAHGLGETNRRSIPCWSCTGRQSHSYPNATEFQSSSATLSGEVGCARSIGEAQTKRMTESPRFVAHLAGENGSTLELAGVLLLRPNLVRFLFLSGYPHGANYVVALVR
jgi:hypothetical protein